MVKDLGTHDIDLTAWVTQQPFISVSARTAFKSGREHEDLVAAVGTLADGTVTSHLVNWLSPMKERVTIVTGEKGAFIADTLTADLTFHANGTCRPSGRSLAEFRGVSEGDVVRYAIAKPEPLRTEHEAFRDAVLGKEADIVTMRQGLATVAVAEAMLESAPHGPHHRGGCALSVVSSDRGKLLVLTVEDPIADRRAMSLALAAADHGWEVTVVGRAGTSPHGPLSHDGSLESRVGDVRVFRWEWPDPLVPLHLPLVPRAYDLVARRLSYADAQEADLVARQLELEERRHRAARSGHRLIEPLGEARRTARHALHRRRAHGLEAGQRSRAMSTRQVVDLSAVAGLGAGLGAASRRAAPGGRRRLGHR